MRAAIVRFVAAARFDSWGAATFDAESTNARPGDAERFAANRFASSGVGQK